MSFLTVLHDGTGAFSSSHKHYYMVFRNWQRKPKYKQLTWSCGVVDSQLKGRLATIPAVMKHHCIQSSAP
jgi:hypothetical protein